MILTTHVSKTCAIHDITINLSQQYVFGLCEQIDEWVGH